MINNLPESQHTFEARHAGMSLSELTGGVDGILFVDGIKTASFVECSNVDNGHAWGVTDKDRFAIFVDYARSIGATREMIDYEYNIGFSAMADEHLVMSLLCHRAIQTNIITLKMSPSNRIMIAPSMKSNKYKTIKNNKHATQAMTEIYDGVVFADEDMPAFIEMLIPANILSNDELVELEASDILGGHTLSDLEYHEYYGFDMKAWLESNVDRLPIAEQLVENAKKVDATHG